MYRYLQQKERRSNDAQMFPAGLSLQKASGSRQLGVFLKGNIVFSFCHLVHNIKENVTEYIYSLGLFTKAVFLVQPFCALFVDLQRCYNGVVA